MHECCAALVHQVEKLWGEVEAEIESLGLQKSKSQDDNAFIGQETG